MNAPMALTPAGDILANINEMEWAGRGGGSYFKVLRLCEKTAMGALRADGTRCAISTPSPRRLGSVFHYQRRAHL